MPNLLINRVKRTGQCRADSPHNQCKADHGEWSPCGIYCHAAAIEVQIASLATVEGITTTSEAIAAIGLTPQTYAVIAGAPGAIAGFAALIQTVTGFSSSGIFTTPMVRCFAFGFSVNCCLISCASLFTIFSLFFGSMFICFLFPIFIFGMCIRGLE